VDDGESIVKKILDLIDNMSGATSDEIKVFNTDSAPGLTWTKVLSATIGGKTPSKLSWNHILEEVIAQAAAQLKDKKALAHLITVNYAMGKKVDQGYRYVQSAGVSFQGQDAKAAWKAIAHILKNVLIPAEIVFQWEDKSDAAFPGATGKFILNQK
jgi:hypothetical protein